MSLGVAGCTVFAQGTNHPTALNHRIRDEEPYDVQAQRKIKCHYCGCWVKKSSVCYLCKTPQKHTPAPRKNNQKVNDTASEFYKPTRSSSAANGRPSAPRPTSATVRPHDMTSSGQHPSYLESYSFSSQRSQHQQPSQPERQGSFSNTLNSTTQSRTSGIGSAPQQSLQPPTGYADPNASMGVNSTRMLTSQTMNAKVKCSYCGVWVTKGTNCKLCRKPCKMF